MIKIIKLNNIFKLDQSNHLEDDNVIYLLDLAQLNIINPLEYTIINVIDHNGFNDTRVVLIRLKGNIYIHNSLTLYEKSIINDIDNKGDYQIINYTIKSNDLEKHVLWI